MTSGHLYRHMRNIHNCSDDDIEQLKIDVKRRKYGGSAGFPCSACGQMYFSSKSLCTHMKNIHGFCAQREHAAVKCPGCPSTFRSNIQLAEHCGQQHSHNGADFTIIKEEFSSIEAFEKWKRDMEQKTTTRFIVAGVRKWAGGQKTRYNCHLAGGNGDRVDPLVQRQRFRRTQRVHKHCPCFLRRVVHADGKVSAYGCFGHYGHKLDDLSVLEQSQHDESLEEGAPLVKRSRPGIIPPQQRRILKGHKEALALYTGKENLVVYLGDRMWKVLSETDDESEGCTVTLNDTQCKCDVENYHCERCGACATQLSCSCKAVDPAGLPCVHAHAVASFSDEATQLIGPILKKLADDSIPLAATSSSHLDTGPSSSRCSTSPPTTPPEFKNVKLPHNVIVVDGSMDFSKPLGKLPRCVDSHPGPILSDLQDALTVCKVNEHPRYDDSHQGRILIEHQEALTFYKDKENLVVKLGPRRWRVLSAVNNQFEGWIVTVHDTPCGCDWESYHCPQCGACAFRISCSCRDDHASTTPCIHAHAVSILSDEAALLIGSTQKQMVERIPQASSSRHLDASTLPSLFAKPANEEKHGQNIQTARNCRDGHSAERPCSGAHAAATSSHRATPLDGLVLPKQEDESVPQTSSSDHPDEPPQLSPYSDQSPDVMELPVEATQFCDPVRTRRLYRSIPQASRATGSAMVRLSSLPPKQLEKTGQSIAAVEMRKLKITYHRCEKTYEALGLFLRRMLKSKKAADIVTVNSVLKDTMAVLSKDEAASGHQDGTEFAATSQLFTTAAVPPSTAVHVANPMDCKREEILSNDVAASASQMKKVILHPSDAEQKFSSIDGVCKREATSESEGIIAAVALLPENVPVQDTPTSQLVERTAGPSSEVYRNTDPLDRVCKTET